MRITRSTFWLMLAVVLSVSVAHAQNPATSDSISARAVEADSVVALADTSHAPADEEHAVSEGGHDQAEEAHGEEAHGEEHAGGGHGPSPPVFLVIPFAVLLLMIATGPLFYAHHWHHHYPKYAVGLGVIVAAYYVLSLHTTVPIMHAAVEYISFIALLASLFVASGCILIKTDYAGTAKTNSVLLFIGGVISNVIGTTGASMLLIRPYMRLNKGRIKAYHIIFFIFVVSNVGGALTPIGDPPLFLGFLRGVPFFWTVAHVWYIWLPTLLVLIGIFAIVDSRNKLQSTRAGVVEAGGDPNPGSGDEPGDEVKTSAHISIEGKAGFGWLAIVIVAVFLDPKVFEWVPDLHAMFGLPFGIREIIMIGVCFAAYLTADRKVLEGNEFNFEPIREVGWLFVGIFLTMQPALTLIGEFARTNADSLGVTTFYYGTGFLSGVLDNAPTYVSFLSAAMGKFGMDVNVPAQVLDFATHPGAATGFYLQAISVAAVFFGALTYIGNGPNFMVKAIAESAGVQTPSFVGYMIRYSLPILVPIYVVVWLVFFSGYVL
ncbi:MAG: sodium:proton antiporter [Rubricoccaceae bacterium]|nr:sodium:proton antiporter [Rubricoccaceae bacterium]